MSRSLRIAFIFLLIATATASAARSGTSGGPIVPAQERARMHAIAAPFAYLPAQLPRGFIFINWSWDHPGGVSCPNRLSVTFAGSQVGQFEWSSWSPCPTGVQFPPPDCKAHAARSARIAGRVVKFNPGNYMDEVWSCFLGTGSVVGPVEVYMETTHSLGTLAAMRLVASARLA